MSGKIELKVKLGTSLDKRYIGPSGTIKDGYPFWYLEIIGGEDVDEDGRCIGKISSVVLAPTWKQFKELIREIRVHERRIDLTRERKNDTGNWENAMNKAIKESQTKLKEFEIPEIYNKPEFIK